MKCAEKCPSASIPFDKKISYKTYSISNNPGVKKWYIDVETCYLFWLENGGDCSNCISDCEYNHLDTWWHKKLDSYKPSIFESHMALYWKNSRIWGK